MIRILLIKEGKHSRLIQGEYNMDNIYFGDSDSALLRYQSGRDDVHIMALGMIYLIYIIIGKIIIEQPIIESMYTCLRKWLFLESVFLYLSSDSLALLNLKMVPFPPLLATLSDLCNFNSWHICHYLLLDLRGKTLPTNIFELQFLHFLTWKHEIANIIKICFSKVWGKLEVKLPVVLFPSSNPLLTLRTMEQILSSKWLSMEG